MEKDFKTVIALRDEIAEREAIIKRFRSRDS